MLRGVGLFSLGWRVSQLSDRALEDEIANCYLRGECVAGLLECLWGEFDERAELGVLSDDGEVVPG